MGTFTVRGMDYSFRDDEEDAPAVAATGDSTDVARASFEYDTAPGRVVRAEGVDLHVAAEKILAKAGLVGPGGIAGPTARVYSAEEYTAAYAQAEREAAA